MQLLSLSEDLCCDLLCNEDATELVDDSLITYYASEAEFPDDSDESMACFIGDEGDYSPGFDYPDRFRSNSLDSLARKQSIHWMLKVQEFYRFMPVTIYLAVNYLDRFLSSHCLPQNVWALQLLSVACLSLASKMEETLVPTLLDLQVEGAKYIFEPRTVLRMELLVLNALCWRLRSITPFTFMDYFAYKIDPSGKHAKYLVSYATQIILATLQDIDFLGHCPSSLAAAAIICAADEVEDLSYVDPGIAVSWCIGLSKDGISNSCEMMRGSVVDKIPRKFAVIFSQAEADKMEDHSSLSSPSSSPLNKRRKLNNS